MQIKQAKKLVKLDPLTAEEHNKLRDEAAISQDEFIKEIAKRLKESKIHLVRKIVKVIGRQKALGFLERVIEI